MKPIWIVVISVVLSAVVVGGGVYAYTNNKANQEKDDLTARISSLNDQIDTLNATVSSLQSASSTSSSTAATDETVDWKTYSSSDYGYVIKYPTSYYTKGPKVQQYPGETGAQDLIISNFAEMGVQDILTGETIHLDVAIGDNTESLSLDAVLDQYKNKLSTQDVTVNGVTGKKFTIGSSSETKTIYTIFIGNNGMIYTLRGSNSISEKENASASNNFKIMWQIMSTFQFIK
jgi:outer membrane murein-binding lipoprotein Lpp